MGNDKREQVALNKRATLEQLVPICGFRERFDGSVLKW